MEKRGRGHAGFTLNEKLTAVLALITNNNNLLDTSKRLGISRKSLKAWYEEYGSQVLEKLPPVDNMFSREVSQVDKIVQAEMTEEQVELVEEINEASKELANFRGTYLDKKKELYQMTLMVRQRALRRSWELLDTATNLRDVAYLLSVLNDSEPIEETPETPEYTPSKTIRALTKKMIQNANKIQNNETIPSDPV